MAVAPWTLAMAASRQRSADGAAALRMMLGGIEPRGAEQERERVE